MADERTPGETKSLLRVVLVWTAEIVSLAGIATFAIALILNWLVFTAWDLNFLQIASVSDILTSGLTIALLAAPVVVPVSLGLFAGWLLGRKSVEWRAARSKLAPIAVVFVLLALIAAINFMQQQPASERLALLMPWTGPSAVVVTSLLLFIFSTVTRSLSGSGSNIDPFGRSVMITCLSVIAAISAIFALLTEAGRLRDEGFVGSYETELAACNEAVMAKVLWVGERAAVYRCQVAGHLIVEIEPEARTLKPIATR